jgi:hypothetical protein
LVVVVKITVTLIVSPCFLAGGSKLYDVTKVVMMMMMMMMTMMIGRRKRRRRRNRRMKISRIWRVRFNL